MNKKIIECRDSLEESKELNTEDLREGQDLLYQFEGKLCLSPVKSSFLEVMQKSLNQLNKPYPAPRVLIDIKEQQALIQSL